MPTLHMLQPSHLHQCCSTHQRSALLCIVICQKLRLTPLQTLDSSHTDVKLHRSDKDIQPLSLPGEPTVVCLLSRVAMVSADKDTPALVRLHLSCTQHSISVLCLHNRCFDPTYGAAVVPGCEWDLIWHIQTT